MQNERVLGLLPEDHNDLGPSVLRDRGLPRFAIIFKNNPRVRHVLGGGDHLQHGVPVRFHEDPTLYPWVSQANLVTTASVCYEPLERFIDIMERRQSNGGQQRHYPFRHPKWRYPYLEGPSTRPYTPTRSLLLQIHSHSNLANR